MTIPESTLSDDAIRFPSLESLRAAHTKLLKDFRIEGTTPEVVAKIESFIRRGKATGALLDVDADRWTAQSQLDYWATQLYHPGYEPPDATLDDFDPDLAPELPDDLCPYVGLDAFRELNQLIFFGRKHLVDELLDKVKSTHFLAVLGASGSGKSSVVRAGLIPQLKRGALPGSENWICFAPMVPGSNPLINLARLLMPVNSALNEVEFEANNFRLNPAYLVEWVSNTIRNTVVLVVDQFEEIFTLCTDEITRAAFVDNLINLSQVSRAEHRIVITMRSDFEANVVRIPLLQTIFEKASVRVTPLNASELREAIEAPAAQIGLKFEEGVVNALLHDTLGEPAALPLLQFTLLKLWENRERNRITWEAYKKLGGGREALARSADEFYNKLIPEEQVTMRRILLKMVRPGEGLEITSNRVPRGVLYQKAEANDRIDRVLDKLIKARLVRVSDGDVALDEQVEVAHEALVRNWPRLVEWLEEERVTLRQRQRLTTAAEEWQRLNRDPLALWRGLLLEEARGYEDLNSLETEFLEAGYEAERVEAERVLNEVRQQRELEYTKKLAESEKSRAEEQARSATQLRQRRTYLIIALAVAVLLGFVAFGASLQSNKVAAINSKLAATNASIASDAKASAEEAQKQALIAHMEELSAQAELNAATSPSRALLFAIEAVRISQKVNTTPSAVQQALYDALSKTDGEPLPGGKATINSFAVTSDGKWLLANTDNSVEAWNISEAWSTPYIIENANVDNWTTFEANHRILTSLDKNVEIWDFAENTPKRLLAFNFDRWYSPNQQQDANTASYPIDQNQYSTYYAMSPDGHWFAILDVNKTISLFNLNAPQEEPFKFPVQYNITEYPFLTFSPKGNWLLVSGSSDRSLYKINTGNGGQLITVSQEKQFFHSTSNVSSVQFSPDEKLLLSMGDQNELWDVSTGKLSNATIINGVYGEFIFSPDSKILLGKTIEQDTSYFDQGTSHLYMWRLSNDISGTPAAVGPTDGPILSGFSDEHFSKDGHLLLLYSGTDVGLWNLVDGTMNGTHISDGKITGAYLLPDATQVIFLTDGGKLNSFSTATREEKTLGTVTTPADLRVSNDSSFIAVLDESRKLQLFDLHAQTDAEIRKFTTTQNFNAFTFSEDGRWLIAGSAFDIVPRVWDLQNLDKQLADDIVRVFPGGQKPSVTPWDPTGPRFALSHDGHWLANIGDSIGQLFDLTGSLTEPIILNKDVSNVTFSPDNQWLAVNRSDSIDLWDITSPTPSYKMSLHRPADGDPITNIHFTSDNKWLVAYAPVWSIYLWERDKEQFGDIRVLQPLQPHMSGGGGGGDVDYRPGEEIAIDPSASKLAFGKNFGVPYTFVWSLKSLATTPIQLKDNYVMSTGNLLLSPNGRWIVRIPAYSGIGIMWDLNSSDPNATSKELTGNRRLGVAMAFSPDNHWLATGHGNNIYLWDLTSDNPIASPRILQGHGATVWSLAFSPDGRILASGSRDKTIRLWDMQAKSIVTSAMVLYGHSAEVYDIAFGSTGSMLLSNSFDQTTRIWELDFDKMLSLACKKAGRNFTTEEWSLYFASEVYRDTCQEWSQSGITATSTPPTMVVTPAPSGATLQNSLATATAMSAPSITVSPTSAQAETFIQYTIQPGDTLTGIAQKFNVGVDTVIKDNSLRDPNSIIVGQTLKIRSSDQVTPTP